MKYRFWTAVSVAALSAALLASGPAMSQSSLQQNVANQLAEHKITVENLDSMSNTELAEIQLMLNTTEGGDAQKRAMIENLLATQGTCEGNPQLRQQVSDQLAEHRIQVQNVDNITGTQLVVVKSVLDSSGSDAEKRAQIERVFAAKAPMAAKDYLRADAEQCIKAVGADIDLDDLTPDEMLQIQVISSGSEPESAKRQMMEQLAK
jgi:hypothetical protein